MGIPGPPGADLVLAEPRLALGLLQALLSPARTAISKAVTTPPSQIRILLVAVRTGIGLQRAEDTSPRFVVGDIASARREGRGATSCAAATWPTSKSAAVGSSPTITCSNSSAMPPRGVRSGGG